MIDVAMLQSLARRADPTVFDRYGLVVVDECHHNPAVSFAACVEAARARRWLGLTATPYRRDKLEAIIGFHCGPTRHEIKPGAVAGSELVRRELVVHTTTTEVPEDDAAHIQSVFAALVDDDRRTAQISADVQAAVSNGRTCLVLTQRTDHIDAIVGQLAALGVGALVLKGGRGKKARAAVSDAIATRNSDDGIVLVATGSYLGEGFDWPELDTLFLTFPLAFKGRVVQYVGRLLRTHAGKHRVELHDYVDVRVPVLDRVHTKRLPAYATPSVSRHPRVPGGAALNLLHRAPTTTMPADDELDELIEQITVDAYGDEGYWSFRQAFEDEASVPFTASLVGTPVVLTGIDFDGDERRGLVATVERDGSSATISVLDLDLTATDPTVSRLVAAYRRWLGIA